jgi:hypothetical protein
MNLKKLISGRLVGSKFIENDLLTKANKAFDGKPFIAIVCNVSEDFKKLETAIVSNIGDREQGAVILKIIQDNHDEIVINVFGE